MIREEVRSERFPFPFVMRKPEKWDKKLPLVILLQNLYGREKLRVRAGSATM